MRWLVTRDGLERYPSGDTNHQLSLTRILYVIKAVSVVRMRHSPLFNNPYLKGAILVRGCQAESTITTLLYGINHSYRVLHAFDECLVDTLRLKTSMKQNGIAFQDLGMLYCISGTDHIPRTKHVRQSAYIEAYLRFLKAIGNIFCTGLYEEVISGSLGHLVWNNCEVLIAAASVCANNKKKNLFELRMGQESNQLLSDEWVHLIRTDLSDSDQENPSAYMPETRDLELQVRRSAWWLHLWEQCNEFECAILGYSDLYDGFGYDQRGLVVFERTEDRETREKLLRDHIVRVCNCKSHIPCGGRSCGCRARERSCFFCNCNQNCCNNGIERISSVNNDNASRELI